MLFDENVDKKKRLAHDMLKQDPPQIHQPYISKKATTHPHCSCVKTNTKKDTP